MYQRAPGFVEGYPTTEDEMGKYKGYWHFDIFVPSWTKLKAKVVHEYINVFFFTLRYCGIVKSNELN